MSTQTDATYREITIKLPTEEAEKYIPLLEAASGNRSIEDYVIELVREEGMRLWYIERSKPKPSAIKSPVGRPRIAPTERQFRELKQFLETIYTKLQAMIGAEFDSVHGADMARLQMLCDTNDLAGLEAFSREQPWQKVRQIQSQT